MAACPDTDRHYEERSITTAAENSDRPPQRDRRRDSRRARALRRCARRCRRRFWAGSSKGGPAICSTGIRRSTSWSACRAAGCKSPREVWRLHRRLHELRFDTAIDLQCLTKSAIAAWLSGARRRIGKGGERRPRVEPLVSQRTGAVRRHARDRTLSRTAQAAGDRVAGRAIRFAGAGRRCADGRRVLASERTRCGAICDLESRRGLAVEDLAGGAVWRTGSPSGQSAWSAERGRVGCAERTAAGRADCRHERRARAIGAADQR